MNDDNELNELNPPVMDGYTKIPTFKLWVANRFPYMETDFDGISNYELMEALTNYLNNVIKNEENVESNVAKLNQAYLELLNYVKDYFKNLDVQEEINNKLDDLVRDGTLTRLIGEYVQPLLDEQNQEISEFKTQVNNQIAQQNIQIQAVTSGSPLVASSVSQMTDTTRVYVNTTDGNWYYYNGSAWSIGGVYQATSIGDNTVSYNNLTAMLKKKHILNVLNADNIIWCKGYSRYNGNLTTDANVVSSQALKFSKGSIINILDSNLLVRFTIYDLNGVYITNTGTFRNIPSYSLTDDCWVVISFQGEIEDAISTNIQFSAINDNIFNVDFDFYTTSSSVSNTRVISKTFYVGAGTKIKINDYGLINAGGSMADSIAYIGYKKVNNDKVTSEHVNFTPDTPFANQELIIPESMYIRIAIRLKGNKTITEDMLSKFTNLITIDYKVDNINKFVNDGNLYRTYISNDGKMEFIKYTGGSLLFRLINPDHTIIIKKNNINLVEKSFASLLEDFPTMVQEYNGNNYLKLANYSILFYDLNSNEFKIVNANTDNLIGNNIIKLVANGYGQLIDCELLILHLKNIHGAEVIFNSANWLSTLDWKTKCINYCNKLNTTSKNIENYLFFTDQHLMGYAGTDFSTNLETYIGTLQKIYNSIPANFIVSGGDWLNNRDTPENAIFKLGYIDGFMNSMFKNYHGIVGNHDTNYQGTQALTTTAIDNVWYRKEKHAYFKFEGINSINYCFDSGTENNTMTDYRWDQINWFAEQLLADNPSHATVFTHIVWNNDTVQNFADNLTKIINAFNNKLTISLNNINYDFSNCTGHVDYVMCGHIHSDKNDIVNGVLCVATTTFGYGTSIPTFDMITADYDNHKLYLTRFGDGSDRELDI